MLLRLKEIISFRAMLWSLIVSELRTRYKGSFLGFLWTFVNPILMLVVYSTVFATVLRFNIPHYTAFLFIGLLSWNLFATSVQSSTNVIVRQSSLIKKIYFPREILPLSVVGGSLINYLLSLAILLPFLWFDGLHFTRVSIYFPLIVIIELFFTTGLSLLLAAINVYLRDTEHMLGIILMAWFYVTPVFYSMNMIPLQYRRIYDYNPMSDITLFFQDIFYYHTQPESITVLMCAIASLVVFIAGWYVFDYLSKRFAEEV
jgi:lipopolysaccharide transport system permease protein